MRTNDRDLKDVVAMSVRLKVVQDQLQALQSEEAELKSKIRAMLRESAGETTENTTVELGHAAKGTLASWTLEVLEGEPSRSFSTPEIADAIKRLGHECGLPSLRSALARLATQDKIKSLGRGNYRSLQTSTPASIAGSHPLSPVQHAEEGTH